MGATQIPDEFGETPLQIARANENHELVNLMLSYLPESN
jgi:hypothetical protein